MAQNQVVGKGKIYFQAEGETGEDYLGNTPELSVAQSPNILKHYSSDEGVKVLDASVTLQKDETAKFSCDNISSANIARWFLGTSTSDNQSLAAGPFTEDLTMTPGRWFQVGATDDRPEGITGIDNLTATANIAAVAATGEIVFSVNPVNNSTVTLNGTAVTFKTSAGASPEVQIGADLAATLAAALVILNASADTQLVKFDYAVDATKLYLTAATAGTAGNSLTIAASVATPSGATLSGGAAASTSSITVADNFTVDETNGRIFVLEAAPDVADGDLVTITYTKTAVTKDRIVSGRTVIYGSMRFISANPAGAQTNFYWKRVALSSDGDYALKGDDWQKMGFAADILLANDTTPSVIGTAIR